MVRSGAHRSRAKHAFRIRPASVPASLDVAQLRGWRGYHVAVIEPWTSFPVTLLEAESAGTHRHLDPGESFRTLVRATPGNTGQTVQDLLITSTAARRPSLTR